MISMRRFVAGAAVALAFASPAAAQVFTGRIDVTVEDAAGKRLPGVAVDVSGPDTQIQTTDANGQAHFVSLGAGSYTVRLTRAGFSPNTSRSVLVESGSSTALDARMNAG